MTHDSSGDVHSDSADIATPLLNRPHVETTPDLQTYLTYGVAHCHSGEDRGGWCVKEDQEAVACGSDFATAETSKFSADSRMVELK